MGCINNKDSAKNKLSTAAIYNGDRPMGIKRLNSYSSYSALHPAAIAYLLLLWYFKTKGKTALWKPSNS